MIVLDTSVAYALLDRRDRRHEEAAMWYRDEEPTVATTPLVIAEIDHLAATRAGRTAVRAFRHDLAAGAYGVEWWAGASTECVEIAEQHEDLGLGLSDASLMALAARLESVRIATFDQRHFRAVRPLSGGDAFVLVPLDTP